MAFAESPKPAPENWRAPLVTLSGSIGNAARPESSARLTISLAPEAMRWLLVPPPPHMVTMTMTGSAEQGLVLRVAVGDGDIALRRGATERAQSRLVVSARHWGVLPKAFSVHDIDPEVALENDSDGKPVLRISGLAKIAGPVVRRQRRAPRKPNMAWTGKAWTWPPEPPIDTSDIPEVPDAFFETAKLILPEPEPQPKAEPQPQPEPEPPPPVAPHHDIVPTRTEQPPPEPEFAKPPPAPKPLPYPPHRAREPFNPLFHADPKPRAAGNLPYQGVERLPWRHQVRAAAAAKPAPAAPPPAPEPERKTPTLMPPSVHDPRLKEPIDASVAADITAAAEMLNTALERDRSGLIVVRVTKSNRVVVKRATVTYEDL